MYLEGVSSYHFLPTLPCISSSFHLWAHLLPGWTGEWREPSCCWMMFRPLLCWRITAVMLKTKNDSIPVSVLILQNTVFITQMSYRRKLYRAVQPVVCPPHCPHVSLFRTWTRWSRPPPGQGGERWRGRTNGDDVRWWSEVRCPKTLWAQLGFLSVPRLNIGKTRRLSSSPSLAIKGGM